MSKSFHLIFVLILMVMITSCKKDESVVHAEISILQPEKNMNFDVLDTITIVVTVDHPAPRVYLKINLQNDQYTPVQSPLVIENFETGIETRLSYIIDNLHLETNTYNFAFQVTVDGHSDNAYRPVVVHEIAKTLERIVVVEKINSQSLNLVLLNEQMEITNEKIVAGDFGGCQVSSWHQLIFFSGNYQGNLTAMDASNLEELWSIPAVYNPPHPAFTTLSIGGNYLFSGNHSGQITGYNMEGQPGYSSAVTSGIYSKFLHQSSNYLFSISGQANSNGHYPGDIFAFPSGDLLSSFFVQVDPLASFLVEDNRMLIFGNDELSHARTILLHLEDGFIGEPYQPFQIPEEKLMACAEINENSAFLAFENGIYNYSYQESTSLFSNQTNICCMEYDRVNSTLFAADENNIYAINSSGTIILQRNFEGLIHSIQLLYNK